LYLDLVEPIGHKAKERNEDFHRAYSQAINIFTLHFAQDYCENGNILWDKIVRLNSESAHHINTKPK